MRQVRRRIDDLAVTVGVHPWAFGIKSEGNALIKLSRGVTVIAQMVTNMQVYRDLTVGTSRRECISQHVFKFDNGAEIIPPLIESIRVNTKEGARLRAVIVVEHRNLADVLISKEIGEIILIVTSGFPGGAVMELLHMLSKLEKLGNLPFLYFGDHDIESAQIFYSLKFGTMRSAWSNEIEVCPKLVWAGSTFEDLEESPRTFRPHKEKVTRESIPHITDEELEKTMDKWEAKVSQHLKKILVEDKPRDKATYKGFLKTGWLEYEPILKAELEMMLVRPSKFRFADLAQVGQEYTAMFVAAKLQAMSPAKFIADDKRPGPPVERSPARQPYAELASQALEAQVANTATDPQESEQTEELSPVLEEMTKEEIARVAAEADALLMNNAF